MERILKFLSNKKIWLPIESNNSNDYLESLKEIYEIYNLELENLLKSKDINDDDLKEIKIICDDITNSIKYYYRGNVKKAIEKIEEIIKKIEDKGFIINCNKEFMFKIRVDNQLCNLNKNEVNKEEIFHVPFDMRRIIDNGRYSISGVPCLYLADSIEQCFYEVTKNEYKTDDIFGATFKIKNQKKRIFDLSKTPQFFLQQIDLQRNFKIESDIIGDIKNYLYLYPVIAACSFKIKSSKENFKPEYIIPQIIMQILREYYDDIIGIKYFSTQKSKFDLYFEKIKFNYAFLIKNCENCTIVDDCEKYCNELMEEFEISNAYSYKNYLENYFSKNINSFFDNIEDWLNKKLKNIIYKKILQKIGLVEHKGTGEWSTSSVGPIGFDSENTENFEISKVFIDQDESYLDEIVEKLKNSIIDKINNSQVRNNDLILANIKYISKKLKDFNIHSEFDVFINYWKKNIPDQRIFNKFIQEINKDQDIIINIPEVLLEVAIEFTKIINNGLKIKDFIGESEYKKLYNFIGLILYEDIEKILLENDYEECKEKLIEGIETLLKFPLNKKLDLMDCQKLTDISFEFNYLMRENPKNIFSLFEAFLIKRIKS